MRRLLLSFIGALLLISGSPPGASAAPWTPGARVELCRWTILYDAPTRSAETYRRLPATHIATLRGEPVLVDGESWWPVERPGTEHREALSGWIAQTDVVACEPDTNQFRLYVDQAPDLLQPGDIVVAALEIDTCGLQWRCWLFTSAYGGAWGHAAMIVEVDGELHVAESIVQGGVHVVPLLESTAYFYDYSRVLRPAANATVRAAAAAYTVEQAGKPFNSVFIDPATTDSYYCSQLIWQAYVLHGGPDLDADANFAVLSTYYTEQNWLLGLTAQFVLRQIITPDDLYHSPHVTVVNPNRADDAVGG